MFCNRTPAQPKTSLSDRATRQSQMDASNFDSRTGVKHVAESAKYAQPHGDRLSATERAAEMPAIDVDALTKCADQLEAQIKRGREQGLLGDVDLNFRIDTGESSRQKRN